MRLDVHHIVYLSNFGTNRQENLVALCRQCHEKLHGRVFDMGEAEEPGNPDPIRLPPTPFPPPKPQPHGPGARQTSVKLTIKHDGGGTWTPPLAPIDPPVQARHQGQVMSDSALPPPPPRAPSLAPDFSGPQVDLNCPVCLRELCVSARFAVPGKMVRCPVCTVTFDYARALALQASVAPQPATGSGKPEPAAGLTAAQDVPKRPAGSKVAWILIGSYAGLIVMSCTITMTGISSQTPYQRPVSSVAPVLTAEQQIQVVMEEALRRWPYLNTPAGVEATREMIRVRDRWLELGLTPVQALRAAVEEVAPKYAQFDAGSE